MHLAGIDLYIISPIFSKRFVIFPAASDINYQVKVSERTGSRPQNFLFCTDPPPPEGVPGQSAHFFACFFLLRVYSFFLCGFSAFCCVQMLFILALIDFVEVFFCLLFAGYSLLFIRCRYLAQNGLATQGVLSF